MRKTFVFLGPSLPLEEARAVCDAEYLPPVAMGDVQTLVAAQPETIAIIDGFFEQRPAVWHKELLYALSQGIAVWGAASMGALRAAELHAFGMRGVGKVFELYASGAIDADDEVAVCHGDASTAYRSITEALVNIRVGLEEAEQRALISSETRSVLLEAMRATHYTERSWWRMFELGAMSRVPDAELTALREFIKRERPDQKRRDAITLLRALAAQPKNTARPSPNFRFEPTELWRGLVRTTERAPTDGSSGGRQTGEPIAHASTTQRAISEQLRLRAPEPLELRRGALLAMLAEEAAARSGFDEAPDLQFWAERFRRMRGLESPEACEAWMRENQISLNEFRRLVELEWRISELMRLQGAELDVALALEAKRRGYYGAIARQASEAESSLKRAGLKDASLADAGVSAEELHRWCEKHLGISRGAIGDYSALLGFSSVDELNAKILSIYLAESRS